MEPRLIPFFRVRAIVNQACRDLRSKDGALFDFNVNERTLTARLAMYLQGYFKEYKVDCEYNRDIEDKKRLPVIKVEPALTDDIHGKTVFPDIIVHDRGNHNNNLLVIEAKVHWPRGTRSEKDWAKLEAFTHPGGQYQYQWGVFIHATGQDSPADFDIVWFQSGRALSNKEVDAIADKSREDFNNED